MTTMAMGNGVLAVLACVFFCLLARALGATWIGASLASARYKFYLPYFSGRSAYGLLDRLGTLGETGLAAELDGLRGAVARGDRRVFCFPDVFSAAGRAELEAGAFPPAVAERLRAEFRPVDAPRLDDGETVDLLAWSP